jgi:flagellar basal-body rod modification protein FlgD
MSIPLVDNNQATTTNSSQTRNTSNEIGKDSFMQLLMLQMQSQDPLSPMDSSQFFNQLAQLTMLEQLWKMNDLLSSTTSSQQLAQGAQLIGRHVEANSREYGAVSGLVDQVHMISGEVRLLVGEKEVRLDEITSVL